MGISSHLHCVSSPSCIPRLLIPIALDNLCTPLLVCKMYLYRFRLKVRVIGANTIRFFRLRFSDLQGVKELALSFFQFSNKYGTGLKNLRFILPRNLPSALRGCLLIFLHKKTRNFSPLKRPLFRL